MRTARPAAAVAVLLAALLVPLIAPAQADAVPIRIAGANRFATAAAVARAAFPGGATSAVVASGEAFPDALAAAFLAASLPGPVLLVPRDGDASDAIGALQDLRTRQVTVIGGPQAVGERVRAQLAQSGIDVRSIAGEDRYATAAAVVRAAGAGASLDGVPVAFLASGEDFPDALTAAAMSFGARLPLLLTQRDRLPAATADTLGAFGIQHVIVMGGTSAIDSRVADDLAGRGISTERVAGADRTETAANAATFTMTRLGWAGTGVVLVNGLRFPDGIASGPLAGSARVPVLLAADAGRLGTATSAWISNRRRGVASITSVGGPAVLTDAVLDEAAARSRDEGSASTTPAPNGGGTTPTPAPNGGTTTTTTTAANFESGATTTSTTVAGASAAACADPIPAVQPSASTPGLPVPEAPLLHAETARGVPLTSGLGSRTASAKTVDGNIGDWSAPSIGNKAFDATTGFAGSTRYACGELVYTDHLFDAYGADDGRDTQRLAQLDPLNENVPETYRVDPIFQVDPLGELGARDAIEPYTDKVFGPGSLDQAKAEEQYGDAGDPGKRSTELQDAADLVELRLAADGTNVYVLSRTTTMSTASQPALLLLFDTVPGGALRDVPFNSGGIKTAAEVAVFLASTGSKAVDLTTTPPTDLAALPSPSINAAGFVNALEAAIPRSVLGAAGSQLRVMAATGSNADGKFVDLKAANGAEIPNLANVAFRGNEPVRTWFDKQQALELAKGSIDAFAFPLDLEKLTSGYTEAWSPGPGYHEKVFESSGPISTEGGQDGIYQHYGVYVPTAYRPGTPNPMTLWMHWRGGKAHSAATVSPRIMRDQGENLGRIVVAPRGRGSSTWYLGEGQVDFLEVWDNAFSSLSIDANRVYVTGHSMGGWASYLLSVLYPDRFAASFPVEGPVTQGAFVAVDPTKDQLPAPPFSCDTFRYSDYTPCYVDTNDSDARIQHTLPLLKNLRNVPIAIYQGVIDELVPVAGTTRQVAELAGRGYRHRYYAFPTYEHYTHPIVDEWTDGAKYAASQTRNPDPAQVVYTRDMPFECSVERGPAVNRSCRAGMPGYQPPSSPAPFNFDFDHAYWMSELTPVNMTAGRATVDVRSMQLHDDTQVAPEAGGPASVGQAGPFAMTGLTWVHNPLETAEPKLENKFAATLTGADKVRFDTARMKLDATKPIVGDVTTDGPLTLRLGGTWTTAPTVTGGVATFDVANHVLTITLPAGPSHVTITPAAA